MHGKGLALAVAVVLCPALWWPSTALAERSGDSAGPITTSAPTSKPTAAPASNTTSAPSSPGLSSVRPTTSATPNDQAPARPPKDTRTSKSTPFVVDGIAVISNKHRVDATFAPRLVIANLSSTGAGKVRLQQPAATALTAMFAAAKKAGLRLTVRSAYRGYATQADWYRSGDHNLVAAPGASEHQSGLAADLAWVKDGRLVRGSHLGNSTAGNWLTRHAREFGFIVRYPPGTQRITGISYEPWHFRYVGVEAAKGVAKTKSKTLEEYLGLAG